MTRDEFCKECYGEIELTLTTSDGKIYLSKREG